jgi:hypothetical protein
MPRYTIHFTGEKRVDDWDPKRGAAGKARVVDTWEATVESNTKPTPAQFSDFTYERHGIGPNKFCYWPDEPGSFSASRVEDKDGNDDEDGKYLADYDVYVTCTPTQDPVSVGHFGLKPIA